MTNDAKGIILIAGTAMIIAFVSGQHFGSTKTIVTNQLPSEIICQPFRSPIDQKAQEEELKKIKAKPIMAQGMVQAWRDKSEGKGELIQVQNFSCTEKPWSLDSMRATTYYFVKK